MMEQLLAVAVANGPLGIGLLYFGWRDYQRDKREEDRGKRLETILVDNAEADKQVAIAMTVLAERLR